MKKRNWALDEKLAIVLEDLKEKRSVTEICREHQISQTLYYRWRDKFLEGGKKALVNGAGNGNVYKAELEKLQKIIGKQAIQIEILKKRTIYWGQGDRGGFAKTIWLYRNCCLPGVRYWAERLLCCPAGS